VSSSRTYILIYIDRFVFFLVFGFWGWAGDCTRAGDPVIVVRGLGVTCSLSNRILRSRLVGKLGKGGRPRERLGLVVS
jgi:hypothetical protein